MVDFVFANPGVASAWATIAGGAVALLVGIPTLIYLVKYTRRTAELRDEAKRQTAIQSDMYEASVMPLLILEFGIWMEGYSPTGAVLIRNLGRGSALGVQVDPILVGGCEVRFDYVPLIECGGMKPLVCVKDTPMPKDFPPRLQCDAGVGSTTNLHRYARQYILAHDSRSGELRVVTRSLSNAVHEFFFSLELRGSDDFAILVYRGKTSSPGDPKDIGTRTADGS